MDLELQEEPASRRRFKKRWLGWALLAWWGTVATWNVVKPMPAGTNVSSPVVSIDARDIEFLYDLTSTTPAGKPLREQRIFDEVFAIIDNARSFVIADFFLLNDMMGAEAGVHRPLSRRSPAGPQGHAAGFRDSADHRSDQRCLWRHALAIA